MVTGGSSGIGWAFVQRLAIEGARVIACGRNYGSLEALQSKNPTIEVLRCDIADHGDVLELVRTVEQNHGRLDVLINNAAIMERVDFLSNTISDDRIAYEISVNLTGTILLTRRFLPLLRAGRGPMIVMITSGYALIPATRAPTYSATKAGLHSFTMALRRQLSGAGIRVIEVLPPLVDTPATHLVQRPKMSADALVEQVLRDIRRGKDEILPGLVRLVPILMRLIPSYIARRVAET